MHWYSVVQGAYFLKNKKKKILQGDYLLVEKDCLGLCSSVGRVLSRAM